jgi:hypothetical protein
MQVSHSTWRVLERSLRFKIPKTLEIYRLYFSLAFGTKTNPFLNQKRGFLVLLITNQIKLQLSEIPQSNFHF